MGAEEGVLVFEADLSECVAEKVRHDFAGHYNRPDVFQLRVSASAPEIYVREATATRERTEGR
jgi:aliphatic nitrilase